jgi:uncharacterized repeat protein (TIGR03809 family)
MPALQGRLSANEMARRWCALAERRLAHVADLHRTGRWKRYYSEERFAACMLDAIRAVSTWRKLSGQPPYPAADTVNLRPAA